MPQKDSAEKAVRDIRRKTRRKFSAEEKIRIVLEGLRGEESIASLCRREGIVANLYYRWSKEFLEAGKKRLLGDTQREATSTEVTDLRKENARLKEVVAVASAKVDGIPGRYQITGSGNGFVFRVDSLSGQVCTYMASKDEKGRLTECTPAGE